MSNTKERLKQLKKNYNDDLNDDLNQDNVIDYDNKPLKPTNTFSKLNIQDQLFVYYIVNNTFNTNSEAYKTAFNIDDKTKVSNQKVYNKLNKNKSIKNAIKELKEQNAKTLLYDQYLWKTTLINRLQNAINNDDDNIIIKYMNMWAKNMGAYSTNVNLTSKIDDIQPLFPDVNYTNDNYTNVNYTNDNYTYYIDEEE